MKKLIIVIVAMLVIVICALIVMSSIENKQKASYENIYEEIPAITNDDVFDLGEGTQVIYYYQPQCSHCIEYKQTLAEYYELSKDKEGVDIYTIDAAADTSVFVAKDDEKFTDNVDLINQQQEVYIYGTPTAIEVKDGEVTMFGVGSDNISFIMEDALS